MKHQIFSYGDPRIDARHGILPWTKQKGQVPQTVKFCSTIKPFIFAKKNNIYEKN